MSKKSTQKDPISSAPNHRNFNLSQRRHHCLNCFFNIYTAWGYHFIHLPLVDSYQRYDEPHNQELLEASYRFVDATGSLVLLRPDMTLFLLRHVPQIYDTQPGYRLWYADSVVRRAHREDTSVEDIFQSGAELIGANEKNREPETEMLLLCNELIAAVGIPRWSVHIGSRYLYTLFFDHLTAHDPHLYHLLQRAILERNVVELPALIRRAAQHNQKPYRAQECRLLTELFSYIGPIEHFPSLHIGTTALQRAAEKEREALQEVIENVARCSSGSYVIDLSEIGTHSYHTGICFRLYIEGANQAAAAGGRYRIPAQNNNAKNGAVRSAVGFTITLNTIEESLVLDDIAYDLIGTANGHNLAERYHNAQTRRENGERVHL